MTSMRQIDGLPMFGRKSIPEAVQRAVRLRAKGLCEDCGERLPLELHHLRYYVPLSHCGKWGGEPIFGLETPDDLAALCRDCHRQRHIDPAGQWWTDPEEMAEYWDDD